MCTEPVENWSLGVPRSMLISRLIPDRPDLVIIRLKFAISALNYISYLYICSLGSLDLQITNRITHMLACLLREYSIVSHFR